MQGFRVVCQYHRNTTCLLGVKQIIDHVSESSVVSGLQAQSHVRYIYNWYNHYRLISSQPCQSIFMLY
jgi:hypothetical protein